APVDVVAPAHHPVRGADRAAVGDAGADPARVREAHHGDRDRRRARAPVAEPALEEAGHAPARDLARAAERARVPASGAGGDGVVDADDRGGCRGGVEATVAELSFEVLAPADDLA